MFCKPDFCSILSLIVFLWATFDLAWGQLIRPVYVYEGLIKSIHDYFNNTCIILLHNNPNPIETQGENRMRKQNIVPIEMIWHTSQIDSLYIKISRFAGLTENEHLLVLQKYLSMTHHIRTTFMDFHMFSTRVSV